MEYYTNAEAQELLRCKRHHINWLHDNGFITKTKIPPSRKIYIPKHQVDKLYIPQPKSEELSEAEKIYYTLSGEEVFDMFAGESNKKRRVGELLKRVCKAEIIQRIEAGI